MLHLHSAHESILKAFYSNKNGLDFKIFSEINFFKELIDIHFTNVC